MYVCVVRVCGCPLPSVCMCVVRVCGCPVSRVRLDLHCCRDMARSFPVSVAIPTQMGC